MRKRNAIMLVLGVIMLGSLAACSKKNEDQSNSGDLITEAAPTPTVVMEDPSGGDAKATSDPAVTPVPTVTTGPVLSDEEQIMKDMIDRSLLTAGNNYRLKKVIEKARNGEDVTLAYIGGSITEGYNAGTDNNYVKLSYEYFADTYGSRETVHMVNAGLSGTPSTLGLIRSERDIFSHNPDIVFIEFAVNDAQSGMDPVAFESLIGKALKQENEPAVVVLYSVIKSGYTCQNQMAITAFHYKLPGISITNAIQPEFDAARMTWEDWSNDESHPNEYGHKLYGDFIINLFKTVDAAETDEPFALPDRFSSGSDFTDMQMYDKTNTEVVDLGSFQEQSAHAAFPYGWLKEQGTGNNAIQFKITAKTFFIVYKEVNSDTYGTADVYVDGERATNLAGNTAAGWNNPVTGFVFNNDESTEHTIEIKMAEGDEDKAFAILAFGVCP